MNRQDDERPSLSEHMDAQLKEKSGFELSLSVMTGVTGLMLSCYTLARQRSPLYSDRRKLSKLDNIGHGLHALSTAHRIVMCGGEISQRVRAGRPVVADARAARVDYSQLAMITTAATMTFVEVARGRTTFGKRRFSRFGRVFNTYAATAVAARTLPQALAAIDS